MALAAQFDRRVIALLWLAWALYWSLAALDRRPTLRREPLGSRLTHLLPLALGGMLLAWRTVPLPALTRRLWPPSPALEVSGVALVAAGLAFAVWARAHLGRNWSGAVTVKQGHELVRSGPYAYLRHPIYAGLLAAVLGTALASGTVHAALAFAIIAAALLWKVRTEEAFMRATFPGEYERYRAAVPALIPFARLRRSALR
jgi:protein-S-isoprenylcysteine O-methyltransferase Ste14